MTLFAGIISRSREHAVPDAACAALRRAITRNSEDEVAVFKDDSSCFVKVDIGAYGEPAFRVDENRRVSMLAGEPLLDSDDDTQAPQTRTHDLDLLHEAWGKNDWNLLAQARGVFCAAHYRADTGQLSLVADKLCVRPLYYWIGERYVAFATALRILESLEEVPKVMDLRGVTEIAGFGFPLDDRTPYANVHLLRAAEIVQIEGERVSRRQYWRWDEIAPSAESEPELLREAYERFTKGVARRNRRDKTTVAFLSGGMDSRAVVAALNAQGVRVHTFNFAPAGSQDQLFGAEFARLAGTLHEEIPRQKDNPDWTLLMANAWRDSKHRREWPAERPGLAWSGDGGSVGLGHVHMSQRIVELMRAGFVDEAITEFLAQERIALPLKLFKPDVSESLKSILQQGIREELDKLQGADAGRNFHIFLMLNDQRRHLAEHFENLDLHRLELHLPFHDSDFLASIIAVPVELCLYHRFYTKWLELFPPVVMSAPWQVYLNHEPCPLPVPPGLAYQWEQTHASDRDELRKRELLRQANDVLRAEAFPGEILKRGYLNLVTLLYRAGVRDYSYVIEAARIYQRYWTLCNGRFARSSEAAPASSTPEQASPTGMLAGHGRLGAGGAGRADLSDDVERAAGVAE